MQINLGGLDYRDLMDEEEKKEATKKTMLLKVKEIIENSVLSSLEDANIGGRRFISGLTQRKADRVLDALEASEDGVIVMPDKRMILLQEMWSNRLAAPAGGPNRKLMQRIDRIICPDAYKKNEDDDDDDTGTADDKA